MRGILTQDRLEFRQPSKIPAAQCRELSKDLSYYAKAYELRNDAIIAAYASGGYGLKEVGNFFNLHFSTVIVINGSGPDPSPQLSVSRQLSCPVPRQSG